MSDSLNDIGILKRREIEARIVGPLLRAFAEEFGQERTHAIAREVVVGLAKRQGKDLAEHGEGSSAADFADGMEPWTRGGSLETEILEQTPQRFAFNVTRCRYAEMYRRLGIPELGALLSCNRDFALSDGFNPKLKLTRTRTIMEGASHCDFRYRLQDSDDSDPAANPD